jgi:hypothetical protein
LRDFILPRSKLEKLTKEKLIFRPSGLTLLENKRPNWLITSQGERLELDFYIPEIDLAIEVQGGQHYKFVPYFHGEQSNFFHQLRRDREKKEICAKRGIILVEVFSAEDIHDVMRKIIQLIPQKENDNDFVQNLKLSNMQKRVEPGPKLRLKKFQSKKPRQFKKYRKKLLDYACTIRGNSAKIKNLSGELEHAEKLNRVINSREMTIYGLKKFVKGNMLEIRVAFLLAKNYPQYYKSELVNQYNSLCAGNSRITR